MIVYRIARSVWAEDLSGAGARLHGGRWNPKGMAVLYTAPSRALATVEFLVHVDPLLLPRDLRMVSIGIPDDASVTHVDAAALPAGWDGHPPPAELARIGAAWAAGRESLVLEVPSAVVRGDFLRLLNPRHPEVDGVRIVENVAYALDPRLARRAPAPAKPARRRARH